MSYTKYYITRFSAQNTEKTQFPKRTKSSCTLTLWALSITKKSKLYSIGGTENHLHLLFDMHPTLALSDLMCEIKEHSNKWLGQNPNFPYFEGWAVSFAGFTYNLNDKDTVINYIRNQKEHHKTVSFEDEYRQFLIDNGIETDEKYFLKD